MSNQIKVLCLPCAGGSATMYLRWRRMMPAFVELIPVELPGRGSRIDEPLIEQFDVLIEQLANEMQRDLNGRYVLFGHSMGGLLAYGLTRELAWRKRPLPEALFISGSAAPSERGLSLFQFNDAALIADLRRQGGTPEVIFETPELLEITLSVLAADYRLCQSFFYEQLDPLALPIHVFAGRADTINVERLAAWQQESSAMGSLSWFKGGHFFLREDEDVFIQQLNQYLSLYVADEVADRVTHHAAKSA